MYPLENWGKKLPALLVAAVLSACGGGGGGGSSSPAPQPDTNPPVIPPTAPNAPVATGNTATDGFNWFNYRRASIGLSVLTRNALVDKAAQAHSDYQALNNTITHDEVQGNPGFTGVNTEQRLAAAGYTLVRPYATGEVISAATSRSGFYHAEELITAIYHRFGVFEPMFKEMGTGAATGSTYTYFTANLTASNGLGAGLGRGRIVGYPGDGQTGVATRFDSDTESPDPVPNQNTVGYPVSVHSDIVGNITVTSFTIRPRGGSDLAVRLLSNATDSAHTQPHEAAIVPLATLNSKTTYDVSFVGTVDGVSVTRNWSFTTE